MTFEFWSYLLTVVGLTGFYFVGKKKWWAWWINIGCQVLWLTYALVTQQYGFIAASVAYTVVFTNNLLKWQKENTPECKHQWVNVRYTYDPPGKVCIDCGLMKERTDDNDFGSQHG